MTLVNVIMKTDAFFVFTLSFFINQEKIIPLELLGIVICFGTIFIISQDDKKYEEDHEELKAKRTIGIILAILVAFF